jgi:hypothetical protein
VGGRETSTTNTERRKEDEEIRRRTTTTETIPPTPEDALAVAVVGVMDFPLDAVPTREGDGDVDYCDDCEPSRGGTKRPASVVHYHETMPATAKVSTMWDLLQEMVGECPGGICGVEEEEEEEDWGREENDEACRPKDFTFRRSAVAWTHMDMLRLEGATTNFEIVDGPMRARIGDPTACCVYSGEAVGTVSAARAIMYAALVGDVRPGFNLEVAQPCHADCINPEHAFEVAPLPGSENNKKGEMAQHRQRGRPVDGHRDAIIKRTCGECQGDIAKISRLLKIRPNRLRKRLGISQPEGEGGGGRRRRKAVMKEVTTV